MSQQPMKAVHFLTRQGKADAAEEKVRETIQKFPEYGGCTHLGYHLAERNDIAGALEADRKQFLFYLKDKSLK